MQNGTINQSSFVQAQNSIQTSGKDSQNCLEPIIH
jgi:hypothetical protein